MLMQGFQFGALLGLPRANELAQPTQLGLRLLSRHPHGGQGTIAILSDGWLQALDQGVVLRRTWLLQT